METGSPSAGSAGASWLHSATAADALALRFLPLTPALTSIAYHVENEFGVLIFSEPDLDASVKDFFCSAIWRFIVKQRT
ncbi:hypothetical protein AB3X91_06965 [Paraburkholderia sp. BR14263]|uniref:hypothetical protein n=1 Tax=unclassified Paraburkholderia TaxID=2615204 RepID=UPI0034CFA865